MATPPLPPRMSSEGARPARAGSPAPAADLLNLGKTETQDMTLTASGRTLSTSVEVVGAPRAPRMRSWIQRAVLFPLLDCVVGAETEVATAVADLRQPVVVVANHSSDLDCLLVLRALPATLRRTAVVAAAADRFYTGRLRGAACEIALGTIPFDRTPGGGGTALCGAMLRLGRSVVVFPEGTRSRDGRMGRFRSCAARLALETGAPIVPVGISGAFAALPPGAVIPRRRPVAVCVGLPIAAVAGESARTLTSRVEDAVLRLCRATPVGDALVVGAA